MAKTIDPGMLKEKKEEREISKDGEIGSPEGIEVVGKMDMEGMELEKFMNEEVEIYVVPPMNEEEPWVIQVGVNGRSIFIPRGKPWKVKRKYVEVLAEMKNLGVMTRAYIDPATREPVNSATVSGGLRYPFQVTRDDNPKGRVWLQKIFETEGVY